DNGYTGTEQEWLASQGGGANNPYLDANSNATSSGAKATGAGATALGDGAIADGENNTVVGSGASAKGKSNTVVGKGNNVEGERSGAFGDPNVIQANGSYAVGNDNTITGDNSFVVGNNVNTAAKNAVVLGNDSASNRDNTVSVGAAGKERQIIHVAAGVQDTDAVNVKQMKDANTKTLTDAKTYADAGDQATLTSAKGYTDGREVVMRQDYKTADAKVLSDSKAYTDTKVMDLENNFKDVSSRVDQTNQDVRKNRDIAAQGIAGITAMTNIPMPAEQGASTVGLGMGYYDSQSAIAVGASHYFDNGVAIKGAFSTGFNNGNTTAVGAGVSYSWK
ncbi:MAG: YadA-like family protein, partial [Acinetobacter sp.]